MVGQFLRLFSQYRALEAQLEESASARIAAEDRVREYRAKYESAEEKWQAERDRNDYLSRAVMDHQAISAGHLPIFGVVPVPPPLGDGETRLGSPQRRTAREVQLERNAANRQAAHDRWVAIQNPTEVPAS